MKRTLFFAALATATLGVVGCDSKIPVDATAVKIAPSPKKEDLDNVSLDRSKLPADLMTDAYAFYGLSNTAPVDITVSTSKDKSTESGSMQSRLTKIEGDEATFNIDRTGSLKEELGNDTIVLRKDGIYEKAITKGELDKESLELPSDVSKGKQWDADVTLKTSQGSIKQVMHYSSEGVVPVAGIKNIKEALLIKGTGTYTINGATTPVTYQTWYAKGVGLVKNVSAVTPKGQPAVSMLLELTPEQKKNK